MSRIIIPGTQLITKGVYLFECSVCHTRFRYDDPFGPMCTGPNPNQDEHTPTLMKMIRREEQKVLV